MDELRMLCLYNLCCVYTINSEQGKYQFLKKQGIDILSPEKIPPVEELDIK